MRVGAANTRPKCERRSDEQKEEHTHNIRSESVEEGHLPSADWLRDNPMVLKRAFCSSSSEA